MYFHPLNLYPGKSKFFGALECMMTLGLLTGLVYSALFIPCDWDFFAFAGFGTRRASQRCLCSVRVQGINMQPNPVQMTKR